MNVVNEGAFRMNSLQKFSTMRALHLIFSTAYTDLFFLLRCIVALLKGTAALLLDIALVVSDDRCEVLKLLSCFGSPHVQLGRTRHLKLNKVANK